MTLIRSNEIARLGASGTAISDNGDEPLPRRDLFHERRLSVANVVANEAGWRDLWEAAGWRDSRLATLMLISGYAACSVELSRSKMERVSPRRIESTEPVTGNSPTKFTAKSTRPTKMAHRFRWAISDGAMYACRPRVAERGTLSTATHVLMFLVFDLRAFAFDGRFP